MSKYRGKKIVVMGLGGSGVAVARYMAKQGAKVTVSDIRQKTELLDEVNQTADLKIEYEFGKQTGKAASLAELVVLSPGVPLSSKSLDEVREKGVPVAGEVEIAVSLIKEPLISITGTNGKSTVALLLEDMFKSDGKNAFLGGSGHKPLLQHLNEGESVSAVIAELSSFQLELLTTCYPAVAVFTNIDQEHLDRYADRNVYASVKRKLFNQCSKNSFVVLNYDDSTLRSWGNECQGRLLWFTKQDPMKVGGAFAENFMGAYLDAPNKKIRVRLNGREEIYDLSGFKLLGEHNKENLMAAILAARVQDISPKAIETTINQFAIIPHRMEFIRKKDGVYFFNDSKATNPAAAIRAIGAFKVSPVILIAGGKDRNFEFEPLADAVQKRCKILILVGEAKEKMNRAVGDFAETYLVGTFEEAVLLAFQKSRSGDIILLSPACDSQDMFRSYEERGDYFKKLVFQL